MRLSHLLLVFITFLIAGISLPNSVQGAQIAVGQSVQTIGPTNVREAPTSRSPVVAILEDGQTVTVRAVVASGEVLTIGDLTSSVWYGVQLEDGRNGFIWIGLLEELPFSPPTPTVGPQISEALAVANISPSDGYVVDRVIMSEFTFEGGGDAADARDFDGVYDDFAVGFRVQWGPEPESDRCGVFFRQRGGGSFYSLFLLPDQNINFGVFDNYEFVDFDRTFTAALRVEPEALNTVLLVAIDDNFNIYVNGELVASFQDSTHSQGDVGLSAATFDAYGQLACRFTDAWTWQFTKQIALEPSPTPLALSTPIPVMNNALTQLGLDPANGALAFQRDNLRLELGGSRDGLVKAERFSGRYENFVLGFAWEWGPGTSSDQCGIYLGNFAGQELNAIMFNQRQEMAVGSMDRNAGQAIDRMRVHQLLVGPEAVNQLVLVVIDQTFSLYLNGEYVTQFRDETYERGELGLVAIRNSSDLSGRCDFSNIWLWEFSETLTSIPSPTPAPDVIAPFIVEALDSVGIGPDEGRLAGQYDQIVLHRPSSDATLLIEGFEENYYNFVIGTDFTWEPTDPMDECGVIFRQENSGLYFLFISQDEVAYNVASGGNIIDGPTRLRSQVPLREGVTNSLLFVGVGDTFSLYINGRYIAQFQDDTNPFGSFSLFSSNPPGRDVPICAFSNTWIWDLGETGPVISPPTPEPSPTPLPEIQNSLDELGISSSSGYVAMTIDRVILNLTGQDNFIQAEWLGEYDDFVLETTITWGPGSVEDTCGVALRFRGGEGNYQLGLNQRQRVGFLDVADGRIRDIAFYDSPTLVEGEGVSNTLRVVASGEVLTIFVNGQYVMQYSNMEAVEGSLALTAETGEDSAESFCVFENTWVWDLAYEAPAITISTPTPTHTPTNTATVTPTPTLTPTMTALPDV